MRLWFLTAALAVLAAASAVALDATASARALVDVARFCGRSFHAGGPDSADVVGQVLSRVALPLAMDAEARGAISALIGAGRGILEMRRAMCSDALPAESARLEYACTAPLEAMRDVDGRLAALEEATPSQEAAAQAAPAVLRSR